MAEDTSSTSEPTWTTAARAAITAAVTALDPDAELDPQGLLDSILARCPPPDSMELEEAEEWILRTAEEELRRQGEAFTAEASMLDNAIRLGRAHGMPAGAKVFTWLIERGLARVVAGKVELKPLGPRAPS